MQRPQKPEVGWGSPHEVLLVSWAHTGGQDKTGQCARQKWMGAADVPLGGRWESYTQDAGLSDGSTFSPFPALQFMFLVF